MSAGNWFLTTPLFLFSSFFSKFFFLTFFPFFVGKNYVSPSITFQKMRKKCSQIENTGKKREKEKKRGEMGCQVGDKNDEKCGTLFFSPI